MIPFGALSPQSGTLPIFPKRFPTLLWIADMCLVGATEDLTRKSFMCPAALMTVGPVLREATDTMDGESVVAFSMST